MQKIEAPGGPATAIGLRSAVSGWCVRSNRPPTHPLGPWRNAAPRRYQRPLRPSLGRVGLGILWGVARYSIRVLQIMPVQQLLVMERCSAQFHRRGVAA